MKKWILKAIVQKTISYLPFSHNINYIFQKYVTKGVYLSDEYFYDRLGHAKEHIDAFALHSTQKTPSSCLELGTGWYPIVPICFFLIGVEKTYSVDISFLTSKERIKTTLEKILDAEKKGRLRNYIQYDLTKLEELQAILENYQALSLENILEKLHLIYLIEDARQLSLADNSIDLVNSNNTFEHIYPEILIPILADFKRVVNKKNGIMSHFIDMSDHFAHFDKTINIYNFLQYSDATWARIDNSIQPQSRLRFEEYKQIYRDLEIPISTESYRLGNIVDLAKVKLDDKYAKNSKESNAISHCHFISVMN